MLCDEENRYVGRMYAATYQLDALLSIRVSGEESRHRLPSKGHPGIG